jgi:hypothetical protein
MLSRKTGLGLAVTAGRHQQSYCRMVVVAGEQPSLHIIRRDPFTDSLLIAALAAVAVLGVHDDSEHSCDVVG